MEVAVSSTSVLVGVLVACGVWVAVGGTVHSAVGVLVLVGVGVEAPTVQTGVGVAVRV